MDDAGKDVVRYNDQPQDTSEPKTAKTLNPEWFTQPPRPPTPILEWLRIEKYFQVQDYALWDVIENGKASEIVVGLAIKVKLFHNSTNEVNTAYGIVTTSLKFRPVALKISMLYSNELEKLKQEKESNQLKIENFDNASKSLDKLIRSQIPDKSRKGLGFVSYNVVPPPLQGISDTQMVKKLVSDDKLEKKTVFPTVAKIEFIRPKQQEKPVRKLVKYAEIYRPKAVNTARPNLEVVNVVRANQVNVVKASACWVWRPTKLNRSSKKKIKAMFDRDAQGYDREHVPSLRL
ncbi:hypothetical protein Tco_0161970 [Tanacetum coccineum]